MFELREIRTLVRVPLHLLTRHTTFDPDDTHRPCVDQAVVDAAVLDALVLAYTGTYDELGRCVVLAVIELVPPCLGGCAAQSGVVRFGQRETAGNFARFKLFKAPTCEYVATFRAVVCTVEVNDVVECVVAKRIGDALILHHGPVMVRAAAAAPAAPAAHGAHARGGARRRQLKAGDCCDVRLATVDVYPTGFDCFGHLLDADADADADAVHDTTTRDRPVGATAGAASADDDVEFVDVDAAADAAADKGAALPLPLPLPLPPSALTDRGITQRPADHRDRAGVEIRDDDAFIALLADRMIE